MQRLHDKRAQMEAAWRADVDTPKTVFVDSVEDLERGVEEVGFPCIFKPVESLAFKTRFRRHVLEIAPPTSCARPTPRSTIAAR